jgi:hypothetical protein
MTPTLAVTHLRVPSMHIVVDDPGGRVFDAWSWCASDVLEWRRPPRSVEGGRPRRAIDGTNPAGLLFVVRDGVDASYLPRELARLHAPGYGFGDEWALAPYAIDDATDRFYERRVRPRDVLWLAASSVEALVWGLHDWAHFHNHGPFDEPAMTELQCDLLALAWLRLEREQIGLGAPDLERIGRELAALSAERFKAEDLPPPCDLEAVFAGDYPAEAVIRRVSHP